jgi:hypothetical protein
MHLADAIELAKLMRHTLKARRAEVHIDSVGEIQIGAWQSEYASYYECIRPHSAGWPDKRAARTFEDAIEMVDDWIRLRPAKLTNADLGLDADGRFINQQAAE